MSDTLLIVAGSAALLVILIYLFSWMVIVYLGVLLIALLAYVKWHFGTPVYCNSSTRLDGKTVIVTGGNAGVGLETAVDMATRGARVVLGCRNKERAQKAVQIITEKSGSSSVVYYLLDLADFDSIRKFAKEVLDKESRLDILINNAGIGKSVVYEGVKTTKQGYELVFGTNYLGPFLLTYLLLDLLKKSGPSQIINLSSVVHYLMLWNKLDFKKMVNGHTGALSYDASKMGNIMHARELAKRYKEFGIRANAVHPGFVNTEIFTPLKKRISPFAYKMFRMFSSYFAVDCRGGAQTTIYVAVDESAQSYSGEYFSGCQKWLMHPFAKDDKTCEQLWEDTMKLCGLS